MRSRVNQDACSGRQPVRSQTQSTNESARNRNRNIPSFSTDGKVLVLTDSNFRNAVDDNEYVLIAFYAPWCRYSQALLPELTKAADQLAAEGSTVKIAKVDATTET